MLKVVVNTLRQSTEGTAAFYFSSFFLSVKIGIPFDHGMFSYWCLFARCPGLLAGQYLQYDTADIYVLSIFPVKIIVCMVIGNQPLSLF